MKKLLLLLLSAALVFSCSEESIETSTPQFVEGEKTVTLVLDNIPEGYEGEDVYVFTINNQGEIYYIQGASAIDDETVETIPTEGNQPFSLVAYIPTDEDWQKKLTDGTNKYSSGLYSVSNSLSAKNGTFVTNAWSSEVSELPTGGDITNVVSLTIDSPTDGTTVTPGQVIQFTATVISNLSAVNIASVTFTLDGSDIETVNQPNSTDVYFINFNTIDLESGQHLLEVTATNEDGAEITDDVEFIVAGGLTNAATVNLQVFPIDNGFQTVNIFEEITNDTGIPNFERQQRLAIAAFTQNNTEKLEYFINGNLVFVDDQIQQNNFITSFSFDTFDENLGLIEIEVVASKAGGDTRRDFLNINLIEPSNFLPRVQITSPSNNSSFAVGSDINLSVNATDAEGDPICEVRYTLSTSQCCGQITITNVGDPFDFTYNVPSLTPGTYYLSALVYDELCQGGNNYSLDQITITIN